MALDHGALTWTDVQYQADGDHWPVTMVTWPAGDSEDDDTRENIENLGRVRVSSNTWK